MEAILHVLRQVAAGEQVVPHDVLHGLTAALDLALSAYSADSGAADEGRG